MRPIKQKRFKVKPFFWVLALFLAVYLTVPAFLSNLGVDCGVFTRTIFSLSPEDEVEVVLDRSPEEGWSAELSGEDRAEAVAVLNRMRYWYYYLDPAAVIPSGSGWEQSLWLRTGDRGERYKLWEGHIQIGNLIFRVDTGELMALFKAHRPE